MEVYAMSLCFFGGGELDFILEEEALGSCFSFLNGQRPDIEVVVAWGDSGGIKWRSLVWSRHSSMATVAPFN
jgi:hypothetical protein